MESRPEKDERNNDMAAEERPRPSQAEGDRETVEADLEQKEKQTSDKKT